MEMVAVRGGESAVLRTHGAGIYGILSRPGVAQIRRVCGFTDVSSTPSDVEANKRPTNATTSLRVPQMHVPLPEINAPAPDAESARRALPEE